MIVMLIALKVSSNSFLFLWIAWILMTWQKVTTAFTFTQGQTAQLQRLGCC